MRAIPRVLVAVLFVATVVDLASRLSTPVAAQNTPSTLVRFVSDDRLMNQVLTALQKQTAALTALRTRSTAVSAVPFGQVGDALKVYLASPSDPCASPNKGDVAISQTASTRLVVGFPGQRIFVCAARVVAGAAEIPSFIEGTGAACATGASAVSGSTTAANGESYAANGGFSGGNGAGSIMVTNKAGDDLCLQQSGSNRLAGNIVYAYGPQ